MLATYTEASKVEDFSHWAEANIVADIAGRKGCPHKSMRYYSIEQNLIALCALWHLSYVFLIYYDLGACKEKCHIYISSTLTSILLSPVFFSNEEMSKSMS